jgi:hypothetical protein
MPGRERQMQIVITGIDKISKTLEKIADSVDKLNRKLDKLDKKKVEPEVAPKTKEAEKEIGAFAKKMQADITRAVQSLPDVELEGDASDVDRELAEIRAKLKALTDKKIGVGIGANEAFAEIKVLSHELAELSRKTTNVRVRADIKAAMSSLGLIKHETKSAENEIGAFARKLQASISKAIASLPEIELHAESTEVDRKLAKIRQELAAIADARVGIGIEDTVAEKKVEKLLAELSALDDKDIDIDVKANIAAAMAAFGLVKKEVKEVDKEVGAFARDLQGKVARAVATLPEITFKADASDADAALAKIRAQLAALSNKRIGVEIGAVEAHREIAGLIHDLQQLGRTTTNVKVRAEVAAALTALGVVNHEQKKIDRTKTRVVITINPNRVLNYLAAILAGIGAIGLAAGPATAALIALGNVGGAVIQGLGATFAGLSGIGAAVKELDKPASTSGQNSRISALHAVEDAQSALAQSQKQYSRAVRQSTRDEIAGEEQIADAKRAHRELIESLERSEQDALKQLTAAQQDHLRSIKELTRARADYSEQLEDNGRDLRSSMLDEEEAAIRLNDAREALSIGQQNGLQGSDLRDLQRDYERAGIAVETVQDHVDDLKKAQVDAGQTVIDAQDRVKAATDAVQEAEQNLTRVRQDNARQAEQSSRELSRTIRDVGYAQQDSADQVTDAATAVEESQRSLARAFEKTGDVGSAAAGGINQEFNKLGPEGKAFAKFLQGEFIPALIKMRTSIQASMLPKMQDAMKRLLTISPMLTTELKKTGSVIGDLAIAGSKMMTNSLWKRDLPVIMDANNRSISRLGKAGLFLADSWRILDVAAIPLQDRFTKSAESAAHMFNVWIANKAASGELAEFFKKAGDRLSEFWDIIKDVAKGLFDFAEAAAPVALAVLHIAAAVARAISSVSELNHTFLSIIAIGLSAAVVLGKIGTVVRTLSEISVLAWGGLKKLGHGLGVFVPEIFYNRMDNVRQKFDSAGSKIGGFTEKVTKSGKIGRGFSKVTSAIGTGLTGLTSAVPLAGAAFVAFIAVWDGLTTSANEAKDAMAQGGQAAIDAVNDLNNQSALIAGFKANWFASVTGLAGVMDAFTTTAEEQRASLRGVELAQFDAAQAGAKYQGQVDQFGAKAPQAIEAQRSYATATDLVKQKQWLAEEATKSHTQRIKEQQELLLASANADIAYQQGLLSIKDAQENLTTARKQYGVSSDEAKSAELALSQAILQSVENSGASARAHNQNKSSVDQDKAANAAMNIEVARLLNTMGVKAPNAIKQMAASMTPAEAKAAGLRVDMDNLGHAIVKIPGQKPIQLKDPGNSIGKQTGKVQGFNTEWQRAKNKTVTLGVALKAQGKAVGSILRHAGGPLGGIGQVLKWFGFASGGKVVGPGTGTSDDIIAKISNGEYVVNAKASAKNLDLLEAINSGALTIPEFARGGSTKAASAKGGTKAPPKAAPVAGKSGIGVTVETGGVTALTAELEPLAKEIQSRTVPAIKSLTGEYPILDSANILTGTTLRTNWQQNADKVNRSTKSMTRDQRVMQANNTQSWRNINQTVGANTATITGRHFVSLRNGLTSVNRAYGNTASAVRTSWGRIRQYTGDPIRYSLSSPINKGLVTGWNVINKFFQMKKPMKAVPIGFAHGTEDHRAQIARAGSTPRIWAEPETQGEAYIPLAQSKRGRSTNILGSVASDFGYSLMPKQARRFADGGVWRTLQNIVHKRFPTASLNSAYRPGDPGYHGKGMAADFGGPMTAIDKFIGETFPKSIELIHTPGPYNLWHGAPHVYNAQTRAEHRDHVHWAASQANLHGLGALGPSFDMTAYLKKQFAGTRRLIGTIKGKYGNGNVPEAMTTFGNKSVDGAIAKANQLMQASVFLGGNLDTARYKAYARSQLYKYGWGMDQWPPLDTLWTRESNWNPLIPNQQGSGAYGIPQSLPASKMASAGPDWRTNAATQINWGLRYIKGRYHSPASALAWHNAHNWYDGGGIANGKGLMMKNVIRPERLLSPAMTKSFDEFIAVLHNRRGTFRPGGSHAFGDSAPLMDHVTIQTPREATADDVVRALSHQARLLAKQVRK